MTPPRLVRESPGALAVWTRLRERLMALGEWEPIDADPDTGLATMLAALAVSCDFYVRFGREMKAADMAPEHLEEAKASLAQMRRQARALLVEFMAVDPDRQHLAVLDDDGLDKEIVELCRPLVDRE